MIGRRALVAIALIAGLVAGTTYLAATRRVAVVVAVRDIEATAPLAIGDLGVREYPVDSIPAGALVETDAAVGRYPRAPLLRGQLILERGLSERAPALASGLSAPPGTRAIALPVGPAQAVGGAVVPGSRVDVAAVPVQGRAPAGRTVEMLGSRLLVLDVRSESGTHLVRPSQRPGAGAAERIGSVVIAVPIADALRVAERIATSSFVLALAAGTPAG
ncbi:MAG: Flp pilus assembly protein CpaB [Chloroflexi bacterium]|nr:Flp pilus assembly protein CpaB [Chloroflexota bacterium]